jgi:hypothetical protein
MLKSLGEHCTCPKDFSMLMNIFPENLLENSPIFELTIDSLMPCPHPCLNCQLLGVDDVILWAINLVGVPAVAVVGLNSLVSLKEVGKEGIENIDAQLLASGVRALNPDEVFHPDVHTQLVVQLDFPTYFWEPKGFPSFFTNPIWGF